MPGAQAPGFVVAKGSVHRRFSVVLAHLLDGQPNLGGGHRRGTGIHPAGSSRLVPWEPLVKALPLWAECRWRVPRLGELPLGSRGRTAGWAGCQWGAPPRGIGWNRSQLALSQSMAEKKKPPAWSEAELPTMRGIVLI